MPGSPPKRANRPEKIKDKSESSIGQNNDNGSHSSSKNKTQRSQSMRSPGRAAGRVLKPTMSLNRAPSGYKGLARSKLVRSMIVKYFKDTDTDNDGRINHEELQQLYTNLTIGKNSNMSVEEAKQLMTEMDRKQDDSVLMEFEVVGSCMVRCLFYIFYF